MQKDQFRKRKFKQQWSTILPISRNQPHPTHVPEIIDDKNRNDMWF